MPSFILTVRSPWDVGWQLKGIVSHPDLSVTLSDVGWVGEVSFSLPRNELDFVRLGDEIELITTDDQSVLWTGKIVHLRYTSHLASFDVVARGIGEYLLDLPVDGILVRDPSRTPFYSSTLWRIASIAGRRHWHRLAVPSDPLIGGPAGRVADFRGQTLGDVWRFLLNQNKDLVLKPSYLDSKGTVLLAVAERSSTVTVIPIHQFGDWEVEYESRTIQNRILALDKGEESQNLIPDPSFEDITGHSWQVHHLQGSTDWTVRRVNYGQTPQSPTFVSHLTVLQVNLPASNPPTEIKVSTREPISLTANDDQTARTYTLTLYARGQGATIRGFLQKADTGAVTTGGVITLVPAWTRCTWQFGVGPSQAGSYYVGVIIGGHTTDPVTVTCDHIIFTRYYGTGASPNTMPMAIGSADDSHLPDNNPFLSGAIYAPVLKVSWSTPPTYIIWLYGWNLSGLGGWRGDLWNPFTNESWSFTVDASDPHPAPDSLRVRFDSTEPAIGDVTYFVRLHTSPGGTGYASEALYGIRYAREALSDAEKSPYHQVHQEPQVIFRGSLTDWADLITPDGSLAIPGLALAQETLPIVSNQLHITTGKLISQTLTAGSREFTLRALFRKMKRDQATKRLTERV